MRIFLIAMLAGGIAASFGQGLENVIPRDQKPILHAFPPPEAERLKSGVGRFIIFTREQSGSDWDFIAGAWECVPSRPEIPLKKRVEFCHSSWNADTLLDVLAVDDSEGMHPRFVRLQVDDGTGHYKVNLYDINYRSWEVRCIWQGKRLMAFGALDNSIFCKSDEGWFILDAVSGKMSKDVPFVPVSTDDHYWLVRKTGETDGCWSYDRKKRQFISHFGNVEAPDVGVSRSKLSADGTSRAWLVAPKPVNWRGGSIPGKLILQRGGNEDISVPVEMQAMRGSGIPVIPRGIELKFLPEGKVRFSASDGDEKSPLRVWSIDIATGKVSQGLEPRSPSSADDDGLFAGGPVPDYLQKYVKGFGHFGRGGLAPAFLLYKGILKERPEYPDCISGVSRDGRHILYKALKGQLAGEYIYGDLLNQKIVRWKSPEGVDAGKAQEFVWVEE
jgi:hypothetical protein